MDDFVNWLQVLGTAELATSYVGEDGYRSWILQAAHERIAPWAHTHNLLQPRRCPFHDPQRGAAYCAHIPCGDACAGVPFTPRESLPRDRKFATSAVLCRLPATLAQPSDAVVNQLLRVRIGDDHRTGRSHREGVKERLRHVCHATRPLEEADDFAFIIGNGEFIQGADAASDQDHDVRTPDRDDVAPFEPKAGVDHNGRGA